MTMELHSGAFHDPGLPRMPAIIWLRFPLAGLIELVWKVAGWTCRCLSRINSLHWSALHRNFCAGLILRSIRLYFTGPSRFPCSMLGSVDVLMDCTSLQIEQRNSP